MININQYNFKRFVIAAYRLPFKLVKKEGKLHAFQNSGGLVSAMLSLTQPFADQNYDSGKDKLVWVGKSDNLPDEFNSLQIINDHFDLRPVFIPDNINDKFYGGFCNDLIWPLFHYFPSLTVFENSYYDNYVQANKLFYEVLKKTIQPGDFIWVHDYQLFLLPQLIREDFPDVTIAFFLHIPFPSYEIIRIMPRQWLSHILKGMLGADLVGFHTNDYTQNFLKTVRRNLGYETSLNIIHTEGRYIKADTFPIGIDYSRFSTSIATAETGKYIAKLIKQKGNHKLIFSVDRLDYTKGFLQKLHAYEHFLEKNRSFHGKVIFNMVMVPSRDSIARYQNLKKEIEATVGRINGKFSTIDWRPIIYQYKSLKYHELVALYNVSDIALVTPLRDGMNLVAKEFIACRGNNPGVLILSEMAGAAAELNEAILVNPSDLNETSEAISKAIIFDPEEAMEHTRKMQRRISEYDVFSWAADILNNTLKIKKEQERLKVRYINSKLSKEIVELFRKAQKPVLFFDYDGTLVPIKKYPQLAIPDSQILEHIKLLSGKANVVIISGREKEFLKQWFGTLPVYLVAEHGAFIKKPNEDWVGEIISDNQWKQKIYEILKRYVNRCTGSFIEEKTTSLCWHYRNADSELANLRAIELREEVKVVLAVDLPLQIIDGHKVVEIKQTGYTKGTAATKLLQQIKGDFILAIGDDKTDEDLFSVLPPKSVTIKVGKELSVARFNFLNQSEVLEFMECLLNC